jgi:release factor glutamine methyltransferase
MEHARFEAGWLLGQLVGSTPLEVYLEETCISEQTVERFFSKIEARASGIPLQYLLGEAEFFGERFSVTPGVFIPRPETETIVEKALQALQARQAQLGRSLRLLDLGTGSGCIAVTLARALPACVVVGVELSWVALRSAQENVRWHELSARVHLVQGQWVEPVRGAFDGIISNPPYVPSAQVDHLPLDVRQEPRISLDGGENGMRDLCHQIAQVPRVLAPGGIVVLECAEEQAAELMRVVATAAWVESVNALCDLATRPRGILIHTH